MHLTDCFMQLVAYIIYFKRTAGTQQPAYDQVKGDVLRLLNQSEDCMKKGAFPQDDYDQARFMICAWVDEMILSSAWQHKGQWQKEQLQRLYYHTTDAGEEVFNRLNVLGPHQREAREVYYLCLALGFMGRYIHEGDEFLLDQVKTSLLRELLGSSVGLPSLEKKELFPEALPSGETVLGSQTGGSRFSLFTVLCLAAPLALLLVLFLVYQIALHAVGGSFSVMAT